MDYGMDYIVVKSVTPINRDRSNKVDLIFAGLPANHCRRYLLDSIKQPFVQVFGEFGVHRINDCLGFDLLLDTSIERSLEMPYKAVTDTIREVSDLSFIILEPIGYSSILRSSIREV